MLSESYQESKVIIHSTNIPTRSFSSNLEMMSVLMSIEGEQVLIVLLYRPPVTTQQQIRYFIEELTDQLAELQIGQYNTIVLGDFTLDQMHDPYIELFHGICMQFSLTQRSSYSTTRLRYFFFRTSINGKVAIRSIHSVKVIRKS